MIDRARRHPRTDVVRAQLDSAIAELNVSTARKQLDVVDLGGGSGVFAVPLAQAGHQVTVVDPSPNALATLQRRAVEAGAAGQVTGVQGDAAGLLDVVGEQSADIVLCHGVLEVVEDPAAAMAGVAACLRPGGVCSVVAAQRYAAVVAKALAGHLADAARLLHDPDGRWGRLDPLPRRFDEGGLVTMIAATGLDVFEVHGVRVLTELVAGSVVDDANELAALATLEAEIALLPAFRAVAAALHVLARKPAHGS
jgi:SAM-dependent methyltransferase